MRVIQGMYSNTQSLVVNGQYSEDFGVGVGVHQGSVLNPLLFILVLAVLLDAFRTGFAVGASLLWWPGAHRGHLEGVNLQAQGVEGWHGK